MLPFLPFSLPSARDAARVIIGAITTAAGFACVAAPAPGHTLVLPLVFAGAFLAVPVLIRE